MPMGALLTRAGLTLLCCARDERWHAAGILHSAFPMEPECLESAMRQHTNLQREKLAADPIKRRQGSMGKTIYNLGNPPVRDMILRALVKTMTLMPPPPAAKKERKKRVYWPIWLVTAGPGHTRWLAAPQLWLSTGQLI